MFFFIKKSCFGVGVVFLIKKRCLVLVLMLVYHAILCNTMQYCAIPCREGGGLDPIPILKKDFFENHLESFPDCENVFCA